MTQSCEQVEGIEAGMPQLWAKGEYEFTSFGTIYFESKAYYDADCTLPHTTVVDPVPVHLYEPVTYQDLGEKMLQVGITGRGIFIEMTFDGERYPADAFFLQLTKTAYISRRYLSLKHLDSVLRCIARWILILKPV
ncbi:MAG: hypothetical protein DBP00_02995 [gamma proteobacterium symbiont of Ctena orbiculata]|nr:MAG: hypothetical protein DBP00_02995 [gamma proteobacterium symbiont of Ctena orbiculata]